jgi:hypothetical protein
MNGYLQFSRVEAEESYLQAPKGTVIDCPGLTKQTSAGGIQHTEYDT